MGKKLSSSDEILARPEESLIRHLEKTASVAVSIFKNIKHNISFLPQKHLEDILYITAFSHDFGKATNYFQKYIRIENDEEREKYKNSTPQTRHGLLSSIFTYCFIKEYLKRNNLSSSSIVPFIPFLFFLIVKKHHGNLKNVVDTELLIDKGDIEILSAQLEKLNLAEIENFLGILSAKVNLDLKFDIFPKSHNIENFLKSELTGRLKKSSIRNQFDKQFPKNIEHFIVFQFFYSILLRADKESVIFDELQIKKLFLDPFIVEKHKKTFKKQNKINDLRESIFEESVAELKNIDLQKDRIFSLNVPTGTGKTLTALSFALKLREKLSEQFSPQLIYCLPFTSIIEQNFKVFSEVFSQPDSNILLKHHHLSDFFYKTNNEEYEINESEFLTESWESEIVVTTFVQFFHTLFGNKNRALKKFHKFSNSIILLDEVQTVPVKYWILIKEALLQLAKVLNSYIILITATQPEIFDITKEIVPQKESYFNKLDRVDLEYAGEFNLNEFKDRIEQEIEKNEETHLIILNTISSSIQIYDFIKTLSIKDVELFYLSTNIIPKERANRITNIKDSDGRKIVVSTQLVEAGVDIDLDNVWRDFAPLDSINQAAGRCNRNFDNQKKGKVKIFKLKNDNGKFYYSYIYGDKPLDIFETENILNKNKNISEVDFLKNIKTYYENIKKKMSNENANEFIKKIELLEFEDIGNFRLIENDKYAKEDVFIELDDNAKAIWKAFCELSKIENRIEKRNKFLEIKPNFYEYVISIPKKHINQDIKDNGFVFHLRNELIDSYYDFETGWKIQDASHSVF